MMQSQLLDPLLAFLPHRNSQHLCGEGIFGLHRQTLVVVQNRLLKLPLQKSRHNEELPSDC
jgi:hypothetical protein